MQVLVLCFVFSLLAGIEANAQRFPRWPPPSAPAGPAPSPWPAPQKPFVFHYEGPRAGGSYLGVGLVEIDRARAEDLGLSEPSGVEVTNVDRESPADKAGIQRGDVILQFRGQKVFGVEHFIRLVQETPAGRNVAVTVSRDGSEVNLSAEIGRREASKSGAFRFCGDEDSDCTEIHIPEIHIPRFDFRSLDFDIPRPNFVVKNRGLGVELEELDGQLAQYFGVEQGVLVRSVDSNSPAAKAGVQAGDLLVSIAGKSIDDVKDVRAALRSAEGAAIPLEVMRNKSKRTLQLETRQDERGRPERERGFRRNILAPAEQKL